MFLLALFAAHFLLFSILIFVIMLAVKEGGKFQRMLTLEISLKQHDSQLNIDLKNV